MGEPKGSKIDREIERAYTDYRSGGGDWGTHSKSEGSRVGSQDGRKSGKPSARGGGGSKNWKTIVPLNPMEGE